jgi:CheY-like chemotaxis protein
MCLFATYICKMDTNLLILLIEDDPDDIELLEDALKTYMETNGGGFQMETLNDGNAALDYMGRGAAHPDIIILDFNLPKVHGREVVLGIKSSPYANIPLVVLTTSSSREDMDFAHRQGVAQYFTKPTTQAEFARIVNTIVRLAQKSAAPLDPKSL